MIIKSVHLKNFKNYTDFKAYFTALNFIKGENGSGKTSLGLDALLFALFGYYRLNLADLPTRNKAKSCSVEIELEHNGYIYKIIRKYPTALIIEEDGVPCQDGQRYLNKIFGDVITFKKFRMIDNSVGINFLEEGQVALKKILFSLSEDVFNIIRDKLNALKHKREIYNRDKLKTAIHYPSKKRLDVLIKNEDELGKRTRELSSEINRNQMEIGSYRNKKGRTENRRGTLKSQRDKLLTNEYCYACKQLLPKEKADEMLKKINEELIEVNEVLKQNTDIVEELQEIVSQKQEKLETLDIELTGIRNLKYKLDTRLKQADYKYTMKDIEVVKEEIKRIDNLSTRYLISTIKTLEPIINSVLEKINFQVEFQINERGKFNIVLHKGDTDFNYKDLSSGQKLLLQIAFKLALLLERNESGLMIADEGLSNLDEECLNYVLQIFENYPIQLIFMLHNITNIPEGVKVINLNKEKE